MKLLSALGDLRKKLGNKRGNEGPSLPPTDTSGITENKAVPTEDQCPMKALNIHRNAGGSRNSSTVSHLSTSEVDRAASLQLCQHPPYVEPWRNIQFADLCRLFDQPREAAAKQLGLTPDALTKACKANNIDRWPYRKFDCLRNLMQQVEQEARLGEGEKQAYTAAIRAELAHQLSDPNRDLPDFIVQLRHKQYKTKYLGRKRGRGACGEEGTGAGAAGADSGSTAGEQPDEEVLLGLAGGLREGQYARAPSNGGGTEVHNCGSEATQGARASAPRGRGAITITAITATTIPRSHDDVIPPCAVAFDKRSPFGAESLALRENHTMRAHVTKSAGAESASSGDSPHALSRRRRSAIARAASLPASLNTAQGRSAMDCLLMAAAEPWMRTGADSATDDTACYADIMARPKPLSCESCCGLEPEGQHEAGGVGAAGAAHVHRAEAEASVWPSCGSNIAASAVADSGCVALQCPASVDNDSTPGPGPAPATARSQAVAQCAVSAELYTAHQAQPTTARAPALQHPLQAQHTTSSPPCCADPSTTPPVFLLQTAPRRIRQAAPLYTPSAPLAPKPDSKAVAQTGGQQAAQRSRSPEAQHATLGTGCAVVNRSASSAALAQVSELQAADAVGTATQLRAPLAMHLSPLPQFAAQHGAAQHGSSPATAHQGCGLKSYGSDEMALSMSDILMSLSGLLSDDSDVLHHQLLPVHTSPHDGTAATAATAAAAAVAPGAQAMGASPPQPLFPLPPSMAHPQHLLPTSTESASATPLVTPDPALASGDDARAIMQSMWDALRADHQTILEPVAMLVSQHQEQATGVDVDVPCQAAATATSGVTKPVAASEGALHLGTPVSGSSMAQADQLAHVPPQTTAATSPDLLLNAANWNPLQAEQQQLPSQQPQPTQLQLQLQQQLQLMQQLMMQQLATEQLPAHPGTTRQTAAAHQLAQQAAAVHNMASQATVQCSSAAIKQQALALQAVAQLALAQAAIVEWQRASEPSPPPG